MKNKEEKKYLTFRGRNYVAVPELQEKFCNGCALIEKGCYSSVRATAVCRQGYIFKPISEEDTFNKQK